MARSAPQEAAAGSRRPGQHPPAAEPPPLLPVDAVLQAGLRRVMQQHWGHDAFRPLQAEAVAATLSGRDVLVILPTGGGKSLTFQLAPLHRNQVTVVVTPLLALAKDQVNGCLERGIEAAAWSSETPENVRAMLARELVADLEDTTLRLLYTTPESLQTERLRELLKAAHEGGKLCSFAIDEAHCVSEWGHDFRPAYLQLGELRAEFADVPFIAATATATSAVKSSIVASLKLRNPVLLHGSFNRPNIEYQVRYKELLGDGSREAALQDLLAFLGERRGQCGIIYARLRATCDWLAEQLGDADIDCAAYHAGKDSQQRAKIQAGWSEGEYDVVVATIAFGMGIDKADVRYVVHWDPPASIEGFYQESGRAGRDGAPSLSLLYASNQELKEAKRMERGARQGAVSAVAAYIQEPRCRRRALLSYFGERRSVGCQAAQGEGVCDFCQSPKAVLSQLAALEGKLEAEAAAAAAEAVAAQAGGGGSYSRQHQQQQRGWQAAEDPFERCDPGSDGEDQQQRQNGTTASSSPAASSPSGVSDGRATAAAVDDPFSTARSLAARPAANRTAAAAGAAGRVLPPRPAPGQAGSTAAAAAGSTAAGAATAGLAPPRQPLRPLLPNRLKRPISEVAAEMKQQAPAATAAAAPGTTVSPPAAAHPTSPSATNANSSPAAGMSAGQAAQGSLGAAGTAKRTHAAQAGAAGGDGGSTGGAARKPVFRAFKPPRKAGQP